MTRGRGSEKPTILACRKTWRPPRGENKLQVTHAIEILRRDCERQRPSFVPTILARMLTRRYDCLPPSSDPQSGSIHPVICYIIAQSVSQSAPFSRGLDSQIAFGHQVFDSEKEREREKFLGRIREGKGLKKVLTTDRVRHLPIQVGEEGKRFRETRRIIVFKTDMLTKTSNSRACF